MDILSALRNVVVGIKVWVNKKLENKVDVVEGKGLSTNDFTTEDKKKIAKLGVLANKNTVEKSDLSSSVQESLNKANTAIQSLDGYATKDNVEANSNRISIIENDYLKSTDKEEFNIAINNAIDIAAKDATSKSDKALVDAKNYITDMLNITNGTSTLDAGKIIERS